MSDHVDPTPDPDEDLEPAAPEGPDEDLERADVEVPDALGLDEIDLPLPPEERELVPADVDPRSAEELLAELVEAESRRDEYLDGLRRARAEFENYRKRTVREAATARDAGRADVTSALLEVLDDLDRTLEAADTATDETLAKGVTLVADKLQRTLEGLGLVRIDAAGVGFDPGVHEAVQHVEAVDDASTPTVERVLRPGYRLHDRVLRPAMVVVAG